MEAPMRVSRNHIFGLLIITFLMTAGISTAAPTVGRGNFELFFDSATFLGDDGQSVTEVYLRVRNSELRFKEVEGKYEGQVRLRIEIMNPRGKVIETINEDLKFTETNKDAAESPLQFYTVIKRFNLENGDYILACGLDDINSPKVSLSGIVGGKHRSASVENYVLTVPEFNPDVMSVSGAKFLWDIEQDEKGFVFQPNPTRMYGLYRDSLCVYIESYVPADLASTQDLRFEMEILDSKGSVIKNAAIPLPKRTAAGNSPLVVYPIVIKEDINELMAGEYTLYVNAGMSDQLLVRMHVGGFSIAWDLRTWEVTRRNYLIEARFLLSDENFEDFEKLSLGDQEKKLAAMWKEVDPDTISGVNEAYQEFQIRLEYVRAKFTDYQSGLFSDRGLIYLRYGPPDAMEVDVVPQNRESISDALQKVDDKYHPIDYSTSGTRLRYSRPGDNILVDARRIGMVGEQGDVGFPYELWIYNEGGKPILERDRAMEQDIGIRFIFIDTEGYGRYKLESSSSMMNK